MNDITPPLAHVVLVHPEIPWNTGNAGRTCLALGAKLHLVEPVVFSLDEKAVRRAGLVYRAHVDPAVWGSWEKLRVRGPAGEPGLVTPEGERAPWAGPGARVRGQAEGRPSELRARHRGRGLAVPMRPGPVRSLNVSTTVGMLLKEVADERVPTEVYSPTFVRSMVMLPLPAVSELESRLTAAIAAYWREQREVGDRELRLLGLLAGAAADAMGQASVLEDCRQLRAEARGSQARSSGGPGLSSRMLAVIAHDLRSPLGAVANGLELLPPSLQDAEAEAVTSPTRRSLDRALRLVDHLVTFSEMEAKGAPHLQLEDPSTRSSAPRL
jgi:tRNA (cytidine/uridine-2'-O-)-methyltransferase